MAASRVVADDRVATLSSALVAEHDGAVSIRLPQRGVGAAGRGRPGGRCLGATLRGQESEISMPSQAAASEPTNSLEDGTAAASSTAKSSTARRAPDSLVGT